LIVITFGFKMASLMQRSAIGSRAATIRPSIKLAAQRRTVIVASSAKDLNAKFGIAGSVEVTEGRSGSPMVVLKHASGASAEVYLFGAVVASWKQATGDEVLYVRPDAVFDKSKPISGGIPHCFPQFGPGAMQQHGFARNLDWTLASTSADPNPDDKDPSVELVLQENEYTLKMWPHKFKAVYSVSLHGEQLKTELKVHNTDDKPFDFTSALHTYIEVLSIEKAKVRVLKGLSYLDKSKDPSKPESKVEDRDAITFNGYCDSVYLNSPDHVELDVGTGAAVAIDSSGWEDTVVWNPWTTMEACYKNFVCVENAQFGKAVTLAPGATWSAIANFNVQDSK
jgi:glucose-6-phosphate 1-epimerase